MPELPKKYKKEFAHFYALGLFPTFELLNHRPEHVRAVYYREDFNDREKLAGLCARVGVPYACSPKVLERISQKEICYATGEFEKYESELDPTAPHAALVHPGDMGNLGTIMRTLLGFGVEDLALIGGGTNHWNPKTVRASMGAVFRLRVQEFADFPAYLAAFGEGRDIFPFMLDSGTVLTPETCPQSSRWTLVFGNEATGLSPEFQGYGRSLFIAQSPEVDSLNLAVDMAVGAYLFTQKNGGSL